MCSMATYSNMACTMPLERINMFMFVIYIGSVFFALKKMLCVRPVFTTNYFVFAWDFFFIAFSFGLPLNPKVNIPNVKSYVIKLYAQQIHNKDSGMLLQAESCSAKKLVYVAPIRGLDHKRRCFGPDDLGWSSWQNWIEWAKAK